APMGNRHTRNLSTRDLLSTERRCRATGIRVNQRLPIQVRGHDIGIEGQAGGGDADGSRANAANPDACCNVIALDEVALKEVQTWGSDGFDRGDICRESKQ